MRGGNDRKNAGMVGHWSGRIVVVLVAALTLAGLAACAPSAPAPVDSTAQAPGTFNVHIGGQFTDAFGRAAH